MNAKGVSLCFPCLHPLNMHIRWGKWSMLIFMCAVLGGGQMGRMRKNPWAATERETLTSRSGIRIVFFLLEKNKLVLAMRPPSLRNAGLFHSWIGGLSGLHELSLKMSKHRLLSIAPQNAFYSFFYPGNCMFWAYHLITNIHSAYAVSSPCLYKFPSRAALWPRLNGNLCVERHGKHSDFFPIF